MRKNWNIPVNIHPDFLIKLNKQVYISLVTDSQYSAFNTIIHITWPYGHLFTETVQGKQHKVVCHKGWSLLRAIVTGGKTNRWPLAGSGLKNESEAWSGLKKEAEIPPKYT